MHHSVQNFARMELICSCLFINDSDIFVSAWLRLMPEKCQLILLESRGWRLQGLLYFWSFVGLSSVPSPRSWWEEVCLVLDNPQQPGSSSLLLSAWGVPNPAASMKHDETNNFVNICAKWTWKSWNLFTKFTQKVQRVSVWACFYCEKKWFYIFTQSKFLLTLHNSV